ncbi:MAG: hypothetical protein AB3N33_02785 [Puniceicoccaceae bacterium]
MPAVLHQMGIDPDASVDDIPSPPVRIYRESVKVNRVPVDPEQVEKRHRWERENQDRLKLLAEYWNCCLSWFRQHNHPYPIVEREPYSLVRLLYSTSNLEAGMCCDWPCSEDGNVKGLMVEVSTQYRQAELYDRLWLPRRESIEASTGLKLHWYRDSTSAIIRTIKPGPEFTEKADWNSQFVWFGQTLDALLHALIGNIPWRDWIWNQMRDEERECNRVHLQELEAIEKEQGF